MTTDPAGQYFSPYLGMGNNPVNGVDPDGGVFDLSKLSTTEKEKWRQHIKKIRETQLGRYVYDLIESDESFVVTVQFRSNSGHNNYQYDPVNKNLFFGGELSDSDYLRIKQAEQMGSKWVHPAWVLVGHEIWHAWDHYLLGDEMIEKLQIKYKKDGTQYFGFEGEKYRRNYLEPRAVKFQNYLFSGGNHLATEKNTPGLRTQYGTKKIDRTSFWDRTEFIAKLPEMDYFANPGSNHFTQIILFEIINISRDKNCGC